MKHKPIYIYSCGAVSAYGPDFQALLRNLDSASHCLSLRSFAGNLCYVGAVCAESEQALASLQRESPHYQNLDRSVQLAILAGRQVLAHLPTRHLPQNILINLGSSRGATGLFERYYESFRQNQSARVPIQTSPSTTLGNLSSWLAQDLGLQSVNFSHSVTCSSGLHAIANGLAWLRSGMAEGALVGGTEAPLTAFTHAQMQALRIYSSADEQQPYPCAPCRLGANIKNSLVLSEGSACFYLAHELFEQNPVAEILGIGFSQEKIESSTSISEDGEGLEKAMRQALGVIDQVDLVIMHAPGTIKGDQAELSAINRVFAKNRPALISNKWQVGHSFGASGPISLAYALAVFERQVLPVFPYATRISHEQSSIASSGAINRILINACGFGGNAVSLLVAKI